MGDFETLRTSIQRGAKTIPHQAFCSWQTGEISRICVWSDEYANSTPNPKHMPKYTNIKVPCTQDKHPQLSSFSQLSCYPLKSLADATRQSIYIGTPHYWYRLAACALKNSTVCICTHLPSSMDVWTFFQVVQTQKSKSTPRLRYPRTQDKHTADQLCLAPLLLPYKKPCCH